MYTKSTTVWIKGCGEKLLLQITSDTREDTVSGSDHKDNGWGAISTGTLACGRFVNGKREWDLDGEHKEWVGDIMSRKREVYIYRFGHGKDAKHYDKG